eukprot:m.43487 g.43487  ORF g.43487 m.43487 type:complete len:284 (-) comp11638_c0_seq1:41-892(-)
MAASVRVDLPPWLRGKVEFMRLVMVQQHQQQQREPCTTTRPPSSSQGIWVPAFPAPPGYHLRLWQPADLIARTWSRVVTLSGECKTVSEARGKFFNTYGQGLPTEAVLEALATDDARAAAATEHPPGGSEDLEEDVVPNDSLVRRHFDGAWWENVPAPHLRLDKRMCFVVHTATDTVVATATAWEGNITPEAPIAAQLHWVSVVPDHQGKGLSKTVIADALCRMRDWPDNRYSSVFLTTQTVSARAVALYSKHFGFERFIRPDHEDEDTRAWAIVDEALSGSL